MKVLILLLFLFPSFIFAQYELTGRVTDTDQTPLEYANVLLFNEPDSVFIKGAVSGLKGNFAFQNIPTGSYFLSISALGFKDQYSGIIELPSADNHRMVFSMQAAAEVLDAVEVTAKKPLFEQQIDRTVVNVQQSITAAGATALQVLERSPGINIDRMSGVIGMQGKQGVIVMMNGKALRMDSRALLQLLENLSADQIEKIELISTPPASYDAEGDAGIVNIELIKKEDEGGHAQLTLNSGYSMRGKYGGSLNFNFRKKRFNLFGDLSANHNYTQENMQVERKNVFEEQLSNIKVDSKRPAFTGIYNGRLGLDFYLSEKTVIGALLTGYRRHWTLKALTETTVEQQNDYSFTSELAANEINDWSHWLANLNLRHTFKTGHELSLDLDWLNYVDDNPVTYQERFFNAEEQLTEESNFTSGKSTPIKIKVAKLDYNAKWSERLQMQSGLKATSSAFTNDIEVTTLENEDWIKDPRFTNIFRQEEKIWAAYLSADYKISDQLNAKAGLRYEYYDSDLSGETEGAILVQQFGRFFPTLFLSYQINEEHQLQLSYNERITRPAFTTIAPAFFFWGYNTILAGNPTVRPTISRRISASITHKRALLTLQFSDDDQPLSFQPQLVPEENLVLTKVVNMQDQKTAMLSLNTPITITPWWENRYNLAAYWRRNQPVYDGQVLTREDLYYTANTTHSFQLPKDFGVEVSANWRSDIKWGLGTIASVISMNIGLQKAINEQVNISLNWNDLLNIGSFWSIRYDQPELDLFYSSNYDFDGNIIRLSISWQLGNNRLKKAETRGTGSEEERGRLN